MHQLKVFAANVDGLTDRLGTKCHGIIWQDVLRQFQKIPLTIKL